MLTRDEMAKTFAEWGVAWNEHDLDGVMDLFHDEIYFENWNGGSVRGKENLREAWAPWFANHGDFKFTTEETFIDEVDQKMLFRWQLDSPAGQKTRGYMPARTPAHPVGSGSQSLVKWPRRTSVRREPACSGPEGC